MTAALFGLTSSPSWPAALPLWRNRHNLRLEVPAPPLRQSCAYAVQLSSQIVSAAAPTVLNPTGFPKVSMSNQISASTR